MSTNYYLDISQVQGLLSRRRELHGEWLTQEEPTLPERLAEQYHTECDGYDARICTGDRNGEPMPATPDEWGAINRHARQVRESLLRENPGVTEKQFHEALVATKGR